MHFQNFALLLMKEVLNQSMVVSKSIILSEEQQEVVNFTDGAILVQAGAGSGKTRVLTERIRNLLGITKRDILALTFANKASEELKDRLSDNSIAKDRLFISTFHGFCASVLKNHGIHVGFDGMPHIFESEEDRLKLIEEAIQGTPSYAEIYNNKSPKEKKERCQNALKFIAEIKRDLCSENEYYEKFLDENIKLFYDNYQEILRSQNAVDFDDLILLAYRLFLNNPAIASLYRRAFTYICIDEAQDLNNAQYQLIKAFTNGEHNNVMMVGDPNQSLFAFNGSSPDYMSVHFVNDFNPKIVKLIKNYRSAKKVLEAANKIIEQPSLNFDNLEEGRFEIHKLKDAKEEARWIGGEIQKLIELGEHLEIEGVISYGRIVVLARNRYLFNYLEEILVELEIPYNIKSPLGPVKFESNYARILDLSLKVKVNPTDFLHTKEKDILCKDEMLDKMLVNQIVSFINNLDEKGENFIGSIVKLIDVFRNASLEDDEKSLVLIELEEFENHWHSYVKKSNSPSLRQFKNMMALGQTKMLRNENGVTLSTVHTMKGQEYDIVFVMGMDDYTFPDYRAISKNGIYLTQERNNAYVAFTRAKRFLYVTWPEQRKMPWGDVKNRLRSRFLENFD